jgi:hypothetical protein
MTTAHFLVKQASHCQWVTYWQKRVKKKVEENPSKGQVQDIWRKWKELEENRTTGSFKGRVLYKLSMQSYQEAKMGRTCSRYNDDYKCLKKVCFSKT